MTPAMTAMEVMASSLTSMRRTDSAVLDFKKCCIGTPSETEWRRCFSNLFLRKKVLYFQVPAIPEKLHANERWKTSITLLGSPYTSVLGGVQFHHRRHFHPATRTRFFTPAVGRLEWVINPRARLGFFLLGGVYHVKMGKMFQDFSEVSRVELNDS